MEQHKKKKLSDNGLFLKNNQKLQTEIEEYPFELEQGYDLFRSLYMKGFV